MQGNIPMDLRGTLLRNGPGNFEIGSDEYGWMDGDGLVSSFVFDGGHVTARRKFVRTQALVDESAAGTPLAAVRCRQHCHALAVPSAFWPCCRAPHVQGYV